MRVSLDGLFRRPPPSWRRAGLAVAVSGLTRGHCTCLCDDIGALGFIIRRIPSQREACNALPSRTSGSGGSAGGTSGRGQHLAPGWCGGVQQRIERKRCLLQETRMNKELIKAAAFSSSAWYACRHCTTVVTAGLPAGAKDKRGERLCLNLSRLACTLHHASGELYVDE